MIFSCFTKKLKEKVGGILGGPKGMLGPPSQIIKGGVWGGGGGGGGLAPPLPTSLFCVCHQIQKQAFVRFHQLFKI